MRGIPSERACRTRSTPDAGNVLQFIDARNERKSVTVRKSDLQHPSSLNITVDVVEWKSW